jgi:hypothetical protein
MQPILVVEGISETGAVNVMPDRKLYRALHNGFDSVTVISGGGKYECKALVRAINDNLGAFSPNLKAIALLDRDVEERCQDALIHLLPVAMIENFLLDPDSIWEAIQSVVERTGLTTVDDVSNALAELLDAAANDEAGRRAGAMLGSTHFHPTLPAENIPEQAASFIADVERKYGRDAVSAALTQSKQKVEALRQSNRRREEFHGKTILNEFYKKHIARSGLPKVVFTFEAARHARRRRSVVDYFDALFTELVNSSAR